MKIAFKSVRGRIIWLHVFALASVFAISSLAALLLLRATADDFEQRVLTDHAVTVAKYLKNDGGNWTLALPPDLQALYGRGYGGYALSVLDEGGRVVFSSAPGNQPLMSVPRSAEENSYFHQSRGDSAFYGVNHPVQRGQHAATIQVAQDLENTDVIVDDVVAGFVRRVAWVLLPMFALLLALDIIIVRRALKPVTTASELARAIRPSSIGIRLPRQGLPREVLPLVDAVNQALDRLERGFQTQREFTADAAHELRTPLAVLTTFLDVLPDRIAAGQLRPHVQAMSRIVVQLLELAELESSTLGSDETADLRAVCSEAISMMVPVALSEQKSIELAGPNQPVWVRGNAEMLFRAIRNLVENAIRFTAAGTTVEVDLDRDGIVSVKDRGPGIPPAERELIFRRFWRRNRRTGTNAGLGLSIVQRAVELHGGALAVAERDGGGAVFSIQLTPV
jgi:signal transduction histidine kinase